MKRIATIEHSEPGEELTNKLLQRAVDDMAQSGGGVVEIPSGIYAMRDALHLRDGVQLIGETGTVLQKVPSQRSALPLFVGYGHYEFSVAEPEKFSVGTGVLVTDDKAGGFYSTAATIVEQRGEYFFIDRPFVHDYVPSQNASVTSIHSLIDGHGVRGAGAKNITLDGNWPAETQFLNGCRGGGVFLLDAHKITLDGLEVRNFHGDAISFQQCTDISVENCFLHHCAGGGLHPGSGTVRYFLCNNRLEDNGGCGIFYCLRTTHSLCEGNTILRNGREGISVGERDTDHIIQNNTISENQSAGILLRTPIAQSGDRVWIEGNELRGNNRSGEFAEFFISHDLHDVCFTGNRISAASGPAVVVQENCSNIFFGENQLEESTLKPANVQGAVDGVTFSPPQNFPAVGPQAAPSDSARHLNICELPPLQ